MPRLRIVGLAAPLVFAALLGAAWVFADEPKAEPTRPADPPPFQLEMKPDGTFTLYYRQVPLVNADYHFWEANWKWVAADGVVGQLKDGEQPIGLRIPKFGIEAAGKLSNPSPNVLVYDLAFKRSINRTGVIGGGLEFVLDLKSPLFKGASAPPPKLLDGNTGWEWALSEGHPIKVTFDPPVSRVFFENNNPGRIRAFLVGDTIEMGTSTLKMTVTFPEGTAHKPTLAEEYGPIDAARWIPNAFPSPLAPVDLSTLNHRPGTHGFLKAVVDRLEFEDGTPARFWGINVMAYGLFSAHADIARHARRLAMLGFNLVRLHHHDTTAWVSPTVIDKHTRSSRLLDPAGMDRVDYWIKCLRENGIYVWLDLHSYREFREGDRATELGEVVTYDEFAHEKGQPGQVKGFCQYDPVLQKLMIEFQSKYLSHVNPYTGLAYKDDPAVAFVLLTNEDDITCHYGVRALAMTGNKELHRLFTERAHAFAEKSGVNENDLQRPWAPGPPQIFLNDQEESFYSTLTDGLRQIGAHALVADGNMWGGNSLSSVPSLTYGDVIDAHDYGPPELLTADPRYKPNLVSMIGIQQVAGKPLTVSEWNLVDNYESAVDRFTAPLCVASVAALQGWDALILYGYSQQPLSDQPRNSSVWDAYNDPGLLASMPAAAIVFRNGHVSPAKKEYCLALSRDALFSATLRPENCAAARTLIEQSRFTMAIPPVPELTWLKPAPPPADATVFSDPNRSFLPPDAHRVVSDTGEITRDWLAGYQTIDTPKSQIGQGAVGGNRIQLSNVTMDVQTRHASIAVTALDEQSIGSSKLILITTVARVFKPPRSPGAAPDFSLYSEPVRGTLTIKARPGLEAVALTASGRSLALSGATYADGAYTISLARPFSHWYLLREKPAQ